MLWCRPKRSANIARCDWVKGSCDRAVHCDFIYSTPQTQGAQFEKIEVMALFL